MDRTDEVLELENWTNLNAEAFEYIIMMKASPQHKVNDFGSHFCSTKWLYVEFKNYQIVQKTGGYSQKADNKAFKYLTS